MGIVEKFLPKDDRFAALLLYGMVFSTCFNGYDAGIMTVILADKQFIEYYSINDNKSGLVATIPWAMTGLAQLWLGGSLAGWFGRLWALRVSICIMIIGVVVEVIPNSFGVLILGRLLTGLGFGCVYISTNLYVAECAPTKLRGSFVGTVSQFGYQLGTLIAFWSGYGMSFHKSPYNIAWRVSNIIQIPIGLAFIVVSFWYPESPRYMLEKHPETPERALNVLSRLRSGAPTDERIRREFHELVASYEFRRRYDTGYIGLLKNKSMRKRLLYGIYAASLQQCGGIASLTMYATLIYQSLGWDTGSQALTINGIQSVLQLLIVFVNTFTVDRFGRRGLLLAGFAIQSLALLIMSCLTTAYPTNGNKAAAIVEVAMLFIVGLTYCWSNGPIAPTVVTEIFPQHVRDKGFVLAVFQQKGWGSQLLATVWFEHSCWDRCAIQISVYFILPETKGISLERMDTIFGGPDNVAAGESEGTSEKREAMAIMNEGEETPVAHVEDAAQDRSSRGPERSSV
ncbi:Major facilitator superfamily domain, general substrate transporter [Penicillium expansum]|uniref:Major facilitator superfamily domain, general substrate transporter n=1 Tax=Penicillium expansum TaxID=27334 RepID=A0A0A2JJV9_PENEN|nr:Major facilitator superfamily domain, general substrate transporter [Penicillium expansum]KGO46452.1 Major facilitator superfamily domain, general substrate transporter [Penicillium expansum]KGO55644.1 Major facilitator superfamily domain, general substrate transporter [Penicillium expansum]